MTTCILPHKFPSNGTAIFSDGKFTYFTTDLQGVAVLNDESKSDNEWTSDAESNRTGQSKKYEVMRPGYDQPWRERLSESDSFTKSRVALLKAAIDVHQLGSSGSALGVRAGESLSCQGQRFFNLRDLLELDHEHAIARTQEERDRIKRDTVVSLDQIDELNTKETLNILFRFLEETICSDPMSIDTEAHERLRDAIKDMESLKRAEASSSGRSS
jgi:hypothetical protein